MSVGWGHVVAAGLAGLAAGLVGAPPAHGQVVLDGTVGPAMTLTGPDFQIPAALGTTRGANLFHSFGRLDLQAGDRATFTGPAGLSNVIARVTGGSASTIDGSLRSEVPGANLYLINPWGVHFGPNAALRVDGSFHVSTANYIRFADGARFDARTPAQSVLTSAPPEAFGFLSDQPAAIRFSGARARLADLGVDVGFQAGAGADLSISAGEVVLADGTSRDGAAGGTALYSDGGRISISGIRGRGELAIVGSAATDSVGFGGAVTLSGRSTIEQDEGRGIAIRGGRVVLEQEAMIHARAGGTPSPGAIDIRSESFELRDRAWVVGSTAGASPGPAIAIRARGTLAIPGEDGAATGSRGRIASLASGSGRSGTVTLAGARIVLGSGASVLGSTAGAGALGEVVIQADEAVVLAGSAAVIADLPEGSSGSGSLLTIAGGTIEVRDDAFVATLNAGSGQGGRLLLSAGQSVRLSERAYLAGGTVGTGNAGAVTVQAPRIVFEGGSISASTSGAGQAGDVELRATESIRISGGNGVASTTSSAGHGGRIVIAAPSVALDATAVTTGAFAPDGGAAAGSNDGGNIRIEADALRISGGTQVGASTHGAGAAGQVVLVARDLEISGTRSGVNSASFGGGPGGAVEIVAGERIALVAGATVLTSTNGRGDAGSVTLRSGGQIEMTGDSSILTLTSAAGNAGAIRLAAPRIRIASSFVSTASQPGDGTGIGTGQAGSVTLEGGALVLDNARLYSTTATAGRAGDVTLSGSTVTIAGGQINASTQGGAPAGAIRIRVDGTLEVSERATISSLTSGGGHGGAVDLSAGRILVRGGALVEANSLGAGEAGNVTLRAAGDIRLVDATVATAALGANGGNIAVLTPTLVVLQRSSVTGSAFGGGDGGNIVIDPRFVVLLGNSRIAANAVNGNGGNITIRIVDGGTLLVAPQAAITASSEFGVDGTVRIEGRVSDVSGGLRALAVNDLDAAGLVRTPCAERRAATASSFVVSGRPGRGPGPDAVEATAARGTGAGAARVAAAPAGRLPPARIDVACAR